MTERKAVAVPGRVVCPNCGSDDLETCEHAVTRGRPEWSVDANGQPAFDWTPDRPFDPGDVDWQTDGFACAACGEMFDKLSDLRVDLGDA